MSNESPTDELVEASSMMGRVKKSVPSANLRQGATLRLLRTFSISGKATHDVEYGTPLKLSASRVFQGFGEQQFFSTGGRVAMS